MLVTVTVTPGSSAPCSSLTVPSMVPLIAVDCAKAAMPSARLRMNAVKVRSMGSNASSGNAVEQSPSI